MGIAPTHAKRDPQHVATICSLPRLVQIYPRNAEGDAVCVVFTQLHDSIFAGVHRSGKL